MSAFPNPVSSWSQYALLSGQTKPERKTSEEFMFGSEPIIGYRLWSVGKSTHDSLSDFLGLLADAHDAGATNPYRWALKKTQQTLLRPIAQPNGGAWLPGVTEARCTASNHKAPSLQCECGFWALRDEQQLVAAFDSYKPAAWGTVKMWGRFCEFEKGYRAQYAYPEKVTLLNGDDTLAYELAAAYGCEVGVGDVPDVVTVARAKRAEERKNGQHSQDSLAMYYESMVKQYMSGLQALPSKKSRWWSS